MENIKEIKVAIVGFGGISRAHNKGYELLRSEGVPVRVTAVCDKDETRFTTAADINLNKDTTTIPSDAELYTDIDELIKNGDFDMVDICLPTYLHKEVACKMMRAGKHVLSEKPMALNSDECAEMLNVYRETGKKFMIAQCLRFGHAYLFLKECIDTGKFGSLKNLYMARLSKYPIWGADHWFESTELSGGCILDTHIHDIDMARFLLSEPEYVSTVSYDGITRWQTVNTRLFYKDVTVIADATWDEAPTKPFAMSYRARFEAASVVFENGKVTVYPNEGEVFEPELKETDFYTEEIRFFVEMLLGKIKENTVNPPESAYMSVKLIEALRESAEKNGERVKFNCK